eukprot:COSAG01_NODE_7069_length_3368_cov_4.549709_1_plen_53_part_00
MVDIQRFIVLQPLCDDKCDPQKVPSRTLQLMECAWRSIMYRCCRSAPSASAD